MHDPEPPVIVFSHFGVDCPGIAGRKRPLGVRNSMINRLVPKVIRAKSLNCLLSLGVLGGSIMAMAPRVGETCQLRYMLLCQSVRGKKVRIFD